jgi:hypothetical protein
MTEMNEPTSRDRVAAGAGTSAPVARQLPPVRTVAERKPRPDPGPLRIAIGLAGMATASALLTAFLGPATEANAGAPVTTTFVTAAGAPDTAIRHVVRYVQLAPGQTPPPKAVVQQAPAPTPRVVTVTTKQSGG